jgi:hypothetical protein
LFDEKIDVAEIMRQIKQDVLEKDDLTDLFPAGMPASDQELRSALREIAQLTRTIQITREELHDARNVGGVIPSYERFPTPIRQLFRFFSRGLRKGIQFVIQDQVDVNSRIDTVLSAMEKKEELMMQLILRLEASAAEKNTAAEDSEKAEAGHENSD